MARSAPLDERFPDRLLQREVAAFFGITTATIRGNWKGCPRNGDGTYDLRAVVDWKNRGPEPEPVADDPDLDDEEAEVNSPALERFRAAKADMAEDERDQRRKVLLPTAVVRECLGRAAAIMRGTGDRLQRECGEVAFEVYTEGLDEAFEDIDEWLEADVANG